MDQYEGEPGQLEGFSGPDRLASDGPGQGPSMEERLKNDRPTQVGLPPDFGAEQPVLKVHPAFFRARPARSGLLVILPIAATVAAYVFAEEAERTSWALWAAGSGIVVCWGPLLFWWLVVTQGRALEISNKRTVEHRGLLSKSTDEVLHDHVRNIKVDQSFYERVVRIGQIGIASSGSDQTEIVMEDLPDPHRIREVIDLYRPLD